MLVLKLAFPFDEALVSAPVTQNLRIVEVLGDERLQGRLLFYALLNFRWAFRRHRLELVRRRRRCLAWRLRCSLSRQRMPAWY